MEGALERASARLVVFGEDAAHAELTPDLVSQEDTPGGGPGHRLHIEVARGVGDLAADRLGVLRPLQQVELF